MRYIITIALAFLINLSFAQERLTSFTSDNTNAFYLLEEIDETKYIIEIDRHHNLSVGILNGDGTVDQQHSKTFKGTFDAYSHFVKGNLMFLFDDTTPVIYDFVNDIEILVNVPSAYLPQFWVNHNDDYSLIRVEDFGSNSYKHFLVTNQGEVLPEDESLIYVADMFPDYLLKLYFEDNNQTSYYIEHIETGVKDTLMKSVTRRVYTYHENELIYIANDDAFYRYSFIDGTKSKIGTLSYPADKVRSIKVMNEDIYIQHYTAQNKYVILRFSLEEGTFKQFYSHENLDDFNLSNSYVAQNKLVVLDRSYLLIFDLDSGEASSYFTDFYTTTIPLLDDRYIFNTNIAHASFIDLKDGTETKVPNEYTIRPYDYAKVVSLEGAYLGVFFSKGSQEKSVYKLDILNNAITHVSTIDKTNEGLVNIDSQVLSFGDNVILVSNDIYNVEGTNVTKVNPFDLFEVDYEFYKIHDDHITFVSIGENLQRHVYSYNGEDLVLEGVIPYENPFPYPDPRIEEYTITSENIFFIDGGNGLGATLKRYHKESGAVSDLSTIQFYGFEQQLFQSDSDVYFDNEGEVFRIDEDGNLNLVINNVLGNSYDNGVIENNGNCYNIGSNSISILDGDAVHEIVEGEFELGFFSISDASAKSFLIRYSDPDLRHKVMFVEEDYAMEIDLGQRITNFSKRGENQFFIYSLDEDTEEQHLHVFDGNVRELFSLPYIIDDANVDGLLFRSGQPYITARNYTLKKHFLYQLDQFYQSPTLVYTADFYGGYFGRNFLDLNENGMLYFSADIGVVDEEWNVKALNVKGDGSMHEMVLNEEGFVYFLANDAIYGNQLFRVDPTDFLLETHELGEESSISLFPNPASSYINVEDAYIGHPFEIIDLKGRILDNGSLHSSQINVAFLAKGMYVLKISLDGVQHSTTFIKH